MDLLKEIQSVFPKAEAARIYFGSQNILLEQQYGFTPKNTRFAEGGCCDEINELDIPGDGDFSTITMGSKMNHDLNDSGNSFLKGGTVSPEKEPF